MLPGDDSELSISNIENTTMKTAATCPKAMSEDCLFLNVYTLLSGDAPNLLNQTTDR